LEHFIYQSLGNKLPKQYVKFVGRHSMLEHTIRRAQKIIPENKIVTIVSRHHLKYAEVRRQLSPYAVIFPETVSVLPLLQVFWSDWGSPERVKQVQQKLQLNRRRAGDLRETTVGDRHGTIGA
jgi:hypothetical protein